MRNPSNLIIYYCDKELHAIETDLSFDANANIIMDIYFELKKYSNVPGLRHDIKFIDFSCNKYIHLLHLDPSEECNPRILSEVDEKEIITIYNTIQKQQS